VDRNYRLLCALPPMANGLGNLPARVLTRHVGTTDEFGAENIQITSFIGGSPYLPKPLTKILACRLRNQVGKHSHGFDGPATGNTKLVNVLDILVALFGCQREPVRDSR
jgi:hypothetical protein